MFFKPNIFTKAFVLSFHPHLFWFCKTHNKCFVIQSVISLVTPYLQLTLDQQSFLKIKKNIKLFH